MTGVEDGSIAPPSTPVTFPGFRVESPPVVRLTGVSIQALFALRCANTLAELNACLADQRDIADTGAALSDELYAAIGAVPDSTLKPALVGLRRAVFQSRSPSGREWNEEVAASLPPLLATRVRAWAERVKAAQVRVGGLDELLESEVRRSRDHLWSATKSPAFLRALAVSSPALSDVLRKWHADPTYRPRRRSITRLVTYLARAAVKTSPYSTFTASGFARWTDNPTITDTELSQARCVLELDRREFDRVRDALRFDPRLRSALTIRINPSATVAGEPTAGESRVGESVRFLAPSSAEPIVSLPISGAVAEVLRTMREFGSLPRAELTDRLAAAHGNPTAVDRFVDKLVAAGLLEAYLPVADQADRPFTELAAWLDAHAPPAYEFCGTLAATVDRELAKSIPVTDLDAQLARDSAVVQTIGQLTKEVRSITGTATTVPTTDAPTTDRPAALHENAVLSGVAAECALSDWKPALTDLDVVRRWLAVQDPALPLRLALAEFIRDRYGATAEVPLLELHHAMQKEMATGQSELASELASQVASSGGLGAELKSAQDLAFTTNPMLRASSDLTQIRELSRLRDEAAAVLLSGAADGTEIVSDPATITAMTKEWPKWLAAPRSLMCFVQQTPVAGAESSWLVLNGAATGYGRGRNRVRQQFRMAGLGHPTGTVTATEDGVRTAEFAGAFGSGLNRRELTADLELNYPGVVSNRPADRRLDISDLVVSLDADTGLPVLISPRLAVRVRPLHLGTMADSLLPPVARLLTHVFGGTYLRHPAAALLTELAETGPPTDKIVHQPRLRVGSVVLRRASWLVPAKLAPVPHPHESTAKYLLRLLGWSRAHGMPERSFVRALGGALFDPELAAENLPYWAFRKSRKPLFVDIANVDLVEQFHRLASDQDTAVLLIEEPLPDPIDSTSGEPDARVAEYLVELSGSVDD